MTVRGTSAPWQASAGAARASAASRSQALTPAEIAWAVSLPTAVLVLVAIVVLGPLVGDTLLATPPIDYGESWSSAFRPEPHEQGRFLVALVAPLLLTALTALAARRPPVVRPSVATALVVGPQLLGVAFVIVCVVAQWRFGFGPLYSLDESVTFHTVYFTLPTLAVAAVATGAAYLGARSPRVRGRVASWARETRTRRLVVAIVAVGAVVLWLSHVFYSEGIVGSANYSVSYHLQFPLDETYAVINGRTPLVDFVSQYGFLWPYPLALGVELLGDDVGVWTALAGIVTGLAMLAMFGVLRRVARSSTVALLLFLPFLAASFFMLAGPLDDRYTFGNYFGAFPIRYAGPFVLAWLTARHLDGAQPRRAWLLFVVAGLTLLNNVDHGLPALGASVAALLWATGRPTRASSLRLMGAVAGGLLAAYALVSLLTLTRTGSLPQPELLLRFSRLFGSSGFGMLPMPTLGLHLVVYLTFVATIAVASVRAIAGEHDRLLTGMLAWSGVFGLGAASYYAGRSHPESLIATFPMWSFCLALLVFVAARSSRARHAVRPPLAELMCVFWFAVLACTLAQTPTPWGQFQRVTQKGAAEGPLLGERFVDANTRPGERVVILMLLGHRIAERVGIDDVAPYFGSSSMPLDRQLDETIEALRDAGGRKVFLWLGDTRAAQLDGLAFAGFEPAARNVSRGLEMWVDRRAR